MSTVTSETVGLILAGGQASRLGGGAKGALLLKGRPLTAYISEELAKSVSQIAINSIPDFAETYALFGFPIVLDDAAYLGRGPLVGLLAGLEWAQTQHAARLLTAPCDAPFLPSNLGERLLGALDGPYDAAIAVTPNGEHPLCAAWNTGVAAALRSHLSDPAAKLAVKAFLANLRVAHVPFTNEADFLNINTLEDFKAAEARRA